MTPRLDRRTGRLRALDGEVRERFTVDPDTGLVVREQVEDAEMVLKHNQHLRDTLPSYSGHAAWRHCASIPATLAAAWAQECGAAIGSPEFAAYAKKKIVTEYPKLLVKGW